MVFRGRPSKGCGECRRKKIGCDQIRPACTQCLKSKDGRPCPGYRDTRTLKFLDESTEVARKAQAKQIIKLRNRASELDKETSSAHSASSSDSTSSSHSSSHSDKEFPLFSDGRDLSPQSPSLQLALVPALEKQGIHFFLANYATADSEFCLGHLQNLLSWKVTRSQTLQAAMEAVGLAGLSNQRSDPSLLAKARTQYAVALRMTKSHLADADRCKQDRTLTAVALLGLFEVVTCSGLWSINSWANHIDGSLALINLRGADLLKSAFGRAIFTQARSHILVSCYQRECPVPSTILSLGHQLAQLGDHACRVTNDLIDITSDLCMLRASIKDQTVTSPTLILATLLSLDGKLVYWASQRSSEWDYTVIFDSTQPDAVYEDSYAIYRDSWIAGTWNFQRTSRIFIQEAVIVQLDKMLVTSQIQATAGGVKDLLIQRNRALAIIFEMSSEIFTSLPYIFGHDGSSPDRLTHPAPAACAYFLIPSLFLIGSTMGVPISMRLYAVGRLKYIGYRVGIQQALVMAGILETKIEEGEVETLARRPNRGLFTGPWGGNDTDHCGTGLFDCKDGGNLADDEIARRLIGCELGESGK